MASIDPTREQFGRMMKLEIAGPIHMLNMLRFRDKAEYEAGHPLEHAGLTGAEAYSHYGEDSAPIFSRVGGVIRSAWNAQTILIGPEGELWHRVFVAEYPNVAAFGEMVKDADYQVAVKHRQAAIADSRLVCMSAVEAGANFAD